MDFSLFYFGNESAQVTPKGRYDLLIEGAKFADENGLAAIWTPERHFHQFGALYPNPAVTGAALAAVTENVGIRAGSVVAPLHNPLRIAEDWAVIDNISNGRAGISFASGWNPTDFSLRPEAYGDRKGVLVDTIEKVRRLWGGGEIECEDGGRNLVKLRTFPPPVQRELPMWVTSAGTAETFRMAGQIKAGVLTHVLHQSLDDLAQKIDVYRRAVKEHEDGWHGHVVLMLHTFLGHSRDLIREIVRKPLSDYIRSSINLTARSASSTEGDLPESLSTEDLNFMVDHSFNKYFEEGGLFGDLDHAQHIAEQVRAIGVDEVACLIDFGVPHADVLVGLEYIRQLRDRVATS
ncbi:MupA/Atu3671 family FMN-dependent luciferase-like monooxygenase [Streptomyces sp. NPDC001279]|uniref:MupA/Atu3671 family FMN-dependent luciferase-like monooxygenase n=1 Tax=Streptomyces sp. NPDC001279 TaxID=3364556 RepID=UPI0036BFB996